MQYTHLLKTAGIIGVFLNVFLQPVYAAENQRPERDGKRFGPPEEALIACKGLTENDACSFTGRSDEFIYGTCSLPPRGEMTVLACRPNNMPEPPEGSPDGNEPPPNRED